MSQGVNALKTALQHYPPIPHSLMIRISRFRRGDHFDSTAPEIEGLQVFEESEPTGQNVMLNPAAGGTSNKIKDLRDPETSSDLFD